MAILDELVTQIDNPDLRARIAAEVEKLAKQKKFGLVFEEHSVHNSLRKDNGRRSACIRPPEGSDRDYLSRARRKRYGCSAGRNGRMAA